MSSNNIFKGASWIWYAETSCPDTYGDFEDHFVYTGGKVICRISCDGDYTLFVNGVFVSSNQYGCFEHYKIYDSVDITEHLTVGDNKLLITVWHLGIGSSRYKPAPAGLLYEVEQDGNILCQSSVSTLCRENPNYKSGYKKMVTPQLGQSFLFDATRPETDFHRSFLANKQCRMYPRPTQKLQLQSARKATVLKDEGNHYLLDLGEECVGLPTVHFYTSLSQKITVCWGEHLIDGNVRAHPYGRDFSFEYIAAEGQNDYTNYMLRLGCRYLEVFCQEPIRLDCISIIPQVYPVKVIPKKLPSPTEQRIYDLCVKTLKLCLMEHYVDTPWREQALYAFDARNQMLCGYKVFEKGNREYARANLILFSQDDRDDNLLSITSPNGNTLAIPSFSLHYFTAVKEYLEHTNDISLAYEVYPKLLKILQTYEKQFYNGLAYAFQGKRYWNFYDWSDHMNQPPTDDATKPDLMINCLLLNALDIFQDICRKIQKPFKYTQMAKTLKSSIKAAFFKEEIGLFSMSEHGNDFTELGNAIAVLTGLTTEDESRVIAQKLISGELPQCSLSMKCFKFDALLKIDPKYRSHIVREICDIYQIMLDNGATSVWEVAEGASAFHNVGSLCHGWSATPVLYL